MTIDSAISDFEKMMKHQENTAAYNIRHGGTEYAKMAKANKKKAFEYRQLAEWLWQLKQIQDIVQEYHEHYIEWGTGQSSVAFHKIVKIIEGGEQND